MIFFDLGNTLECESAAEDWRITMAIRILERESICLTRDDFNAQLRESSKRRVSSVFNSTLRRLAPSEGIFEELVSACKWRQELLYLRSGAKETISRLRRLHRLGIIANQSKGAQKRLLDYGILDFFDVVVSSYDVGVSKPDPKIFKLAFEMAGIEPEACTMVGDRLDNDIGPAKMLGCKTVRILGCYNDSQVAKSEFEVPDSTINELPEMLCDLD